MLTYIDIMYWLLAIGLILKCVLLCLVKTTQYKSSGISSANLLRALEIFDLPPAISPELNKCPGSNPLFWSDFHSLRNDFHSFWEWFSLG